MAYNLIAEIEGPFDWAGFLDFIHKPPYQAIEAFPIASEKRADFIGISIPYKKLDQEADFWPKFTDFYRTLTNRFKLKIFDLYHGIYLTESDLRIIKKDLFG